MSQIRIQRQRKSGWRMPPNTIYVGRPSRWGNPYYPGCGIGYGHFDEQMCSVHYDVREPRVQVHWFKQRMEDMRRDQPTEYEALLLPLQGKNLACWCPLDQPCHADVLLALVNRQVLHKRVLAEGYKDETCPKCKTLFEAHIHFVLCDVRPCPMISKKDPRTLFEKWRDEVVNT
jgi:hypothetical protein